jgi:hypothetical protein
MLSLAGTSFATDEIAVSVLVETQKVHRLEPLYVTFVITNVSTTNVVLPIGFLGYDIQHRSSGAVITGGFRSSVWGEAPCKEIINIPARGSRIERMLLYTIVELGFGGARSVGDFRMQAVIELDGKYWSAWLWDTNTEKRVDVYSPCWSGKVCSAWLDMTVAPIEDAADKGVIEMLSPGEKDAAQKASVHVWSHNRGSRHLYKEALEKYPQSLFAKYCDFYAAERAEPWEWEDAVNHYRNVIEKYPVFQLTDDAKLRLAKIYLTPDCAYKDPAGTRAKALQLLESIVKDHPQSDSVTEARELLKKLFAIPISTGATNGVLRK